MLTGYDAEEFNCWEAVVEALSITSAEKGPSI